MIHQGLGNDLDLVFTNIAIKMKSAKISIEALFTVIQRLYDFKDPL